MPIDATPPPPPLVCIDPGHGSHASGTEAIGPGSRIRKPRDLVGADGEAAVVLRLGRKTRTILIRRGFRVAMTRNGPVFKRGKGGNVDRARFCNRRHAALMLRIHADGSTDSGRHGVSTLYPAWHRGWTGDILPESRTAAGIVQRAVLRTTGASDRGLVRRADLTGFNWANVPVVLVETGFMTNPAERKKLRSPRYQWRVAKGLANGAQRFVNR
jgi:N-acetylmuramoyl-L-alanine amidase